LPKVRKILPPPWKIVVIVLGLYILLTGGLAIQRTRQTVREGLDLIVQLNKEQTVQAELLATREMLNTDTYKQILARQKLGLVKPGEVVYKIIDTKP
jgi:cell division protein FtsB